MQFVRFSTEVQKLEDKFITFPRHLILDKCMVECNGCSGLYCKCRQPFFKIKDLGKFICASCETYKEVIVSLEKSNEVNSFGNSYTANEIIISETKKLVDAPWWNDIHIVKLILQYKRPYNTHVIFKYITKVTNFDICILMSKINGYEALKHINFNELTKEEIFYICEHSAVNHENAISVMPTIYLTYKQIYHLQRMSVLYHPSSIKHINKPCDELRALAIKQDPKLILEVENRSYEQELHAVEKNGLLIEHMKFVDYNMFLSAVNNNGLSIKYFKDDIKETIIKKLIATGYSSQKIKQMITMLYENAVNESIYALEYIPHDEQTENICLIALNSGPLLGKSLTPASQERGQSFTPNHIKQFVSKKIIFESENVRAFFE
jgi:hypothetical protein